MQPVLTNLLTVFAENCSFCTIADDATEPLGCIRWTFYFELRTLAIFRDWNVACGLLWWL